MPRPRHHIFVVQFRLGCVQISLQFQQFRNLKCRFRGGAGTKQERGVGYLPLVKFVVKFEFLLVELLHFVLYLLAVALCNDGGPPPALIGGPISETWPPPRSESTSPPAPSPSDEEITTTSFILSVKNGVNISCT